MTTQHLIKVLVTQEQLQRFQEMLLSTPLVVVVEVQIQLQQQQVVVVVEVVLVQVVQLELQELLEKDLREETEWQPHIHTPVLEVVEQVL